MASERAALGAFLRDRRDRLTPTQAGIQAFPGPRRVPGLRREELAMLAGLSVDYYSRVEQGRQTTISGDVLDALSQALRLSEVERDHLRDLAAPLPQGRRSMPEVPQRADPGLLRLMGNLDHVPAIVLGHRGDVLARNALLTAVLGRPLEPGTSFVRYMFCDPIACQRIVNWADFAQASVGALRREAGRRPHDRQLLDLVSELRGADDDFARWWEGHAVRDYASVAKRIHHPTAGDLSFNIEIVAAPNESDQRMAVYTVQPGSKTAEVLPILASWQTDIAPTHLHPA